MKPHQLAQRSAPARIGIFIGILLLLWIIPALVVIQIWGMAAGGNIALIVLYFLFALLLYLWSQNVYHCIKPFQNYGLDVSPRNFLNLLVGLAIGVCALAIMLSLESVFGWLTWQQIPSSSIILEGLLVALAVGFAEELLFRGWLLDELERDYSLTTALIACSSIFAALHYIKPLSVILQSLPQVFGLFLLGVALVWSKRGCRGRLGLAIGLHAGLVWSYYCVDVGDWIVYTGAVPNWITGINENPLAGVMGLVCLGGIAVNIRHWTLGVNWQQ